MLWKCLVTLTLTFNGIAAHLNTADLSVDCHENLVEMGDQNGRCPWCGAEFEGNCDLVVVEPCGHQSCTGCHFVNNLNRELAKCGFCDAIAGSFTRTHDSTRKAKRGTFTRLYSHGFVLPDTTATVSFTRYDSQTPKPGFLLPDATATVPYHQRSKPRLYITSHHHHGFVHQATHSCFHSLDIKATVSYHQTPQPWFHSRHGFIHQIRQSWFHSCHRIIRQTPQPRYHSPGTTAMI